MSLSCKGEIMLDQIQNNLIQNLKANEGIGIPADSDSLAFCVSTTEYDTYYPPARSTIARRRFSKLIMQEKLWSQLIGTQLRIRRRF